MEYGVICGILLIKILKGNINKGIVGIFGKDINQTNSFDKIFCCDKISRIILPLHQDQQHKFTNQSLLLHYLKKNNVHTNIDE